MNIIHPISYTVRFTRTIFINLIILTKDIFGHLVYFPIITPENVVAKMFEIGYNRYRRGLETCQQAETSKSGHAIFSLFSDASKRRVCLSAESKILASFACIG